VSTEPFWHDGSVSVWHADARHLPLTTGTVDLIVTSPPYYSLRSYTDGGEHWPGQIGDEATPGEYLDALLEVTRECVRVLKPSGSLWVNLGDKYAERAGPPRAGGRDDDATVNRPAARPPRGRRGSVPTKSLLGLPWRYAIRCVDDLGLILRAELVWSKPNPTPESVTDRVRRTHETWFHFTVRQRYYSAIDRIREPYAASTAASYGAGAGAARIGTAFRGHPSHTGRGGAPDAFDDGYDGNPLGRLPGSVWQIASQPLAVPAELGIEHFAAFPMEWPRRLIRAWSPAGVCVECGEGRQPVTEATSVERTAARDYLADRQLRSAAMTGGTARTSLGVSAVERTRTIVGERCGCPEPTAPTTPGVVLDPFGGTGTVGLVARALGRRAHLIDGSRDYCRLARWRLTDPGERARALEVPKPPPVPDGVDALFDLHPSDPTERTA